MLLHYDDIKGISLILVDEQNDNRKAQQKFVNNSWPNSPLNEEVEGTTEWHKAKV